MVIDSTMTLLQHSVQGHTVLTVFSLKTILTIKDKRVEIALKTAQIFTNILQIS